MPAPLVWGLIALGGVGLSGWGFREAGKAADSTAKLIKWGTVAGGLYVSYRALKAGGVLK